ncbi:hypothetical protein NECAME_18857 [Necator americanus]|uniref:Bestrophin homolog n=1 Tax=Necator americanus TaxID=51031 RepID=W2SSF1_NECAM|nr:hypothetical protein NECAME_18857 [Necator americanus]ETN72433.1 hypothetical protein NECAME_18857 [Necator americanus]
MTPTHEENDANVHIIALTGKNAQTKLRAFTDLVDFANSRLSYIPLDLMLGFFVAGVLNRFWYLYNIIGFMDK